MNAERFEQLAAAYGGDLKRWPAAEREAAQAFAARDPGVSERLLFEARQIDAALNASSMPEVSPELRARVLQSAPKARRSKADRGLPWWVWAPGAGLAAACAAGAIFGAVVTAQFAGETRADTVIAVNSAAPPEVAGMTDDDVELL